MKNKKQLGLTLALLLVLLTALSGCAFNMIATEHHQVDQTETVALEETSKIEIDAIGSEIIIVPVSDENVEVTFEGSLSTSSNTEPRLTMKTMGKTMTIKIDYGRNIRNIGSDNTTLTIYIPEDYTHKISANSISGSISIDSFNLSDLVLKSISGEIECSNIQTDSLDADSISGHINALQLVAKHVKANNISGQINLQVPRNMYLNSKTNSVSGSIHTRDGDSTSDDEEIYVDLSTISGDITIDRY